MESIREPEREVPVCQRVDLCVLGGGCTGVFAAVRAARLGLRVALVEQQNAFGGTATAGLVNVWHRLTDIDGRRQIIAGLTGETLERLSRVGAVWKSPDAGEMSMYRLNTEELKIELDRLVEESSVTPYLHTFYCAPVMEDGRLTAVTVENKDGRQAIRADFFIDATGDGDLALHLGLEHFTYRQVQPPTPCFRVAGDLTDLPLEKLLHEHGGEFGLEEDWGWAGLIPGTPGVSFHADTHVFHRDCSSAADLTLAEMEGRRQIRAVMDVLRRYGGDRPLGLAAICAHLGIRETRHFASNYRISGQELLYGRSYEDAVAYGTYPVDRHHADGAGITFRHLDGRQEVHWDRSGPAEWSRWRDDGDYARFYQLPYRAMTQDRFPNFLCAGRMINADEEAFGAIRVMVNLNQLGEAAGVAAYLSLHHGVAAPAVDAQRLRQTLAAGGSAIQ